MTTTKLILFTLTGFISLNASAQSKPLPDGKFVTQAGMPVEFASDGRVIIGVKGMDEFRTGHLIYNGTVGYMNEDAYTIAFKNPQLTCKVVFIQRHDKSVNVRKLAGPQDCLSGLMDKADDMQIDSSSESDPVDDSVMRSHSVVR